MKEKWIGSRGGDYEQMRRGDGRAWLMTGGEKGEAGKMGELIGQAPGLPTWAWI